MFKDEFEVTVSFLTERDHLITISDVTGDGLVLKIHDNQLKESTEIKMGAEDVRKILIVMNEALEYIKEND